MKISKKMLPKGIKAYIKFQEKQGGVIKLNHNFIKKGLIIKGKLVECTYKENETKLEWFSTLGVLYIFVDGKEEYYYENGKLIG
jgi:hypothetical protein